MLQKNKTIFIVVVSLILAAGAYSINRACPIPAARLVHLKIYDCLLKAEYKFAPRLPALKDILLVTIDNDTLNKMNERWPYQRSDFVRVIDNLRKAKPEVIAFDFAFLGKSNTRDDALLKACLNSDYKIVMATSINEESCLDIVSFSGCESKLLSGIVTKIQDEDGEVRGNLTYLVDEKNKGFLSWGMQILKVVKNVDLGSLKTSDNFISFRNNSGEKWVIPIKSDTETYLIHFRGHTVDFSRISFYEAFKGDFNPAVVKNKIVMIGLASSMFGDIHNTPLGWMPGITLNANAFLTLYARDFIKRVHWFLGFVLAMIGVAVSAIIVSSFDNEQAIVFIILELFSFFILSYILLTCNYTWNYSFFILAAPIFPFIAKKIYKILDLLHIL